MNVIKNIFIFGFFSLRILFLKLFNRGKVKIFPGIIPWNANICVRKSACLQIGKAVLVKKDFNMVVWGELEIGKNFFANQNVSITCMKKIVIGNNVKIANNVVIVDHDHDFRNGQNCYRCGDIVIEDDVWIGANCVILRNTHIGTGAVIAAGAIVKGEIPAKTCFISKRLSDIRPY